MERDINYFATIVISISFAVGIAIGVTLGIWALPLSVIAAGVGAWAVHRFFKVEPSNDLKG